MVAGPTDAGETKEGTLSRALEGRRRAKTGCRGATSGFPLLLFVSGVTCQLKVEDESTSLCTTEIRIVSNLTKTRPSGFLNYTYWPVAGAVGRVLGRPWNYDGMYSGSLIEMHTGSNSIISEPQHSTDSSRHNDERLCSPFGQQVGFAVPLTLLLFGSLMTQRGTGKSASNWSHQFHSILALYENGYYRRLVDGKTLSVRRTMFLMFISCFLSLC